MVIPAWSLRLCPDNPRYFQCGEGGAGQGRAVLLAGSHHWDNLVDNQERPPFDYGGYLDRLGGWGHNLIRLWSQWAWSRRVDPVPYLRTGPGMARDGGPKFDLSRFDDAYFQRLCRRVERAGERGIYVAVMLFQGWSLADYGEGDPWPHHPYHRDNNVNGLDGDPDGRGDGLDVHSLRLDAVTRLQERYVERVVDAVGELPHVLFEISNESPRGSLPWQIHILEHLRAYLAARGRRPPLGLTSPYGGGANRQLLDSPADWISPDHRGGFRRSPPPADGSKVILLDTDHLWGVGGDRRWVWKAFTRGYNLLYMDPLVPAGDPSEEEVGEQVRRALGQVVSLSRRLDLAAAHPAPKRSTGGYGLADLTPGRERLVVYLPRGRGRVDLRDVPGELTVRWLQPATGWWVAGGTASGGRKHCCQAPFPGDAVLVLDRPLPGP